jgi:hypothetical protein
VNSSAAALFDLAALSARVLTALAERRIVEVQAELQLLQQLFSQRATGRLFAALARDASTLVRHEGIFVLGLAHRETRLPALAETARAQVSGLLRIPSPTVLLLQRGDSAAQALTRRDAVGFAIIELPNQSDIDDCERVLRHELGHAHLMSASAFVNEGIATCCEHLSLRAAALERSGTVATDAPVGFVPLRALLLLDGSRDLSFAELQSPPHEWVHALAARFVAYCHQRMGAAEWVRTMQCGESADLIEGIERALGESIEAIDARLRPWDAATPADPAATHVLLDNAVAQLFSDGEHVMPSTPCSRDAAQPGAPPELIYADGLQNASRVMLAVRKGRRPRLVDIAYLHAAGMRLEEATAQHQVLCALAEMTEAYRLMSEGTDWQRIAPAFDRAGARLRRAQQLAPADAIVLGLLGMFAWNSVKHGRGDRGTAIELLRRACTCTRFGPLFQPFLAIIEQKEGPATAV